MPTCALCDSDTEGGEPLCAACLASPDQRELFGRVAARARTRAAVARHYAVARDALRLARRYRAERTAVGGTARGAAASADARVEACIAEVRRCREAVRELRAA